MNRRILLQVSVVGVILSLYLALERETRAQQDVQTPAAEANSPTDNDSSGVPKEDSSNSGTSENDKLEGEAMPAENEAEIRSEEAFQRALAHEQKNELDEAITNCTEAISLDPTNVEYLITRAELYGEMRNFDKALEDSAKILEADPNNLRAHILRAKTFELSGDTEKALTEFNEAVERNPTDWQALLERYNYYGRQGERDKALADADRMTQLAPDLAAGSLARALTHSTSGEWDQAMNYSSALIQRNPENWLAYVTRAASRSVQGDDAGALEDIEAALKLSPDNPSVLNSRGMIYFVTREYEKGLADLRKAVELSPRHTGFKADLADFLATCPDDRLRDGKEAAEYANDALRLDPHDFVVWRACASAAAENGDFKQAVKWQERLLAAKGLSAERKSEGEKRLRAYRADKPYRVNLPTTEQIVTQNKIQQAAGAVDNNNFDRAIALVSEAITVDNKNWAAYYVRANAYFKQKKYDLAIADLTRAIEINPQGADGYACRWRAFEATHNYPRALDDLLMVERLDPDRGSGMRNELAWFFATCPDDQLRNGSKADEYVDRALQSRPDDPEIWDTCAAALAENGDFDGAVEWEKMYLGRKELSDAQRHRGEERLGLYIEHTPFRNDPK